jgi:hypothetical protein
MISFKKYITEVTAESYDYDWDSFTFKMGEGDFTTVNGRIINYSIEHDKNVVIRIVDHIEHHEISFAVSLGYRDTTVKTDTGNPFRVFMTVKKMTDEYMKKYGDKIKMVTFSAAKTDEEDLGRTKLYTRFAKQWPKLYSKQTWVMYSQNKGVEGTYFYAVNQKLVTAIETDIIDKSKLTKL